MAQAVGKSMEPLIVEGDFLVFEKDIEGSKQNLIVLAEHHKIEDPDTNSSFTVKKYTSTKKPNIDTEWEHDGIVLKALNQDYEDILINPEDAENIQILAIVKGKYDPETQKIVSLKS